jgi:transcriptional regulator with XRE-family HTH domain
MSVLSRRLRQARFEKGLTQAQLAEKAGISAEQEGLYERSKSEPTARNLYGMSRALDVSTDYLLGLSDTKERR